MKLKYFVLPDKVEIDSDTATASYAKYTIAPFEKGWGHTIGNALRRALLASVQGAAITSVRIDGVDHEFTPIPDVLEDGPEIILNLKKIRMRLWSEEPKLCYLHAKGKGSYRAKDMELPPEVTVANPDQHILTITDAKKSVNIELKVESGRGYMTAERIKKGQTAPIGTIFLDAFFSPVKKVDFNVESTRVLDRADFERVVLEIWTDGTVTPEEAFIQTVTIVKNHMTKLIPTEKEPEFVSEERLDKDRDRLRELLKRDIDELEISNRSSNCLKKGRSKRSKERISINTIGDLVQRTEREMLDIENFGRKSLEELKKVLEGLGLTFGMDVTGLVEEEMPSETPRQD